MPSKKITLLDRAKGDLLVAKTMLEGADDVVIDICAYHCQQCVEKVVKFLILAQGDTYAGDHRSDIYLEELKNDEVTALVRQIAAKIDAWATTIRYHHAILSNKKMVTEVIGTCEELVRIAERKIPETVSCKKTNVETTVMPAHKSIPSI
jgi:HEPN domain-containing protein